MKKRYGIISGILTILIVILFSFIYKLSYQKSVSDYEKKTKKSEPEEVCYFIKEEDGYVTVYMHDQKTVFEYTNILVDELPKAIQKEVQTGMKVNTIREVYGFLENYSS